MRNQNDLSNIILPQHLHHGICPLIKRQYRIYVGLELCLSVFVPKSQKFHQEVGKCYCSLLIYYVYLLYILILSCIMKYKIHNYMWNLSRNSQESVFWVLEYIETLPHRKNFYSLLLTDEEKESESTTISKAVLQYSLHLKLI